MAKKNWLVDFLDFNDRRKLFRFMFIVAMISALVFGFLGFNQALGIEGEDEKVSAEDPIDTCHNNQTCNIGHVSCGDRGHQYKTVNNGETCSFSGWIENHDNIWTDPVTLTINGNGCSRSINFSGCGRQSFEVSGCQPGQVSFGANDSSNISINSNCTPDATCGDGNLDPGEECDDGDSNNDDGCDNNCQLPNTCNANCGQEEGGCRGGYQCSNGKCRNASCTGESDCTCPPAPACGDGNLDAGEECDDGNTTGGDGCEANCTKPETCNSVCTDAIGCDGSFNCTTGFCRNPVCPTDADCTCPTCGDGTVDANEECDDGNLVDGDGCDRDCTIPETCNEVCTAAFGCDGGYDCINGTCRNSVCSDETDCVCATCGDGNVDPGEECDDNGDNSPTGICTEECKLTICGDGIVQNPNGNGEAEQCDDGNDLNGDGCSNICTLEAAGDLAITKTPSVTLVRQGDVVTYTVKVTNTGQQTLTGVAIQDDIPDGLSFAPGSIILDNQAVSDVDGFNGVVIRVTIGNLAANQTATIRYGLQVDTTASAASITNIVVADANETDPVQDDATVTTPAAVVVATSPQTGPGSVAAMYLSLAALMAAFAGISYFYMKKTI